MCSAQLSIPSLVDFLLTFASLFSLLTSEWIFSIPFSIQYLFNDQELL